MTLRSRATRLVVAVVGRRGAGLTTGTADGTVAARALSLVAMAVAAAGAGADAGAEVPGVGELVEVARVAPWAWAWPVVRDEWRALCETATAAHEGDVWRRCVATVHASGEVELARLWGATLPGTEGP